ncbi:MAG: UMP kinase, partial [Candidatus Aenigmatarchaeota archaeon]
TYNRAADELYPRANHGEKDWMGIYATMVNAQLIKIMFGSKAAGIYQDPTKNPKTNKPIIMASGWKPGFSTDYDAVLWAKTRKAKTVINLTDVDYIHTADPDLDKTARPIKRMTWEGYKELIGGKWTPGMNVPFDPIASKEAERLGLRVIIINGKDLKNLKACMQKKTFKGSVISGRLV